MFYFAKIISRFIIPPGIFLSLLILFCVLILFKYKKTAKVLFGIILLLLYFFSIPAGGEQFFLGNLEKYSPPLNPEDLTNHNCDAIVVLGGGIESTAGEIEQRYVPADRAMKRIYYAFFLYSKTKLPIIMSGGRVTRGETVDPEALVLKQALLSWGVPEEKLIMEWESRNTCENSFYVKKILDEKQYKKIFLVTSASHMRRSSYFFNRDGVDFVKAPTDYLSDVFKDDSKSILPVPERFSDEKKGYELFLWLPNLSCFYKTAFAIHEWIGYIYAPYQRSAQ